MTVRQLIEALEAIGEPDATVVYHKEGCEKCRQVFRVELGRFRRCNMQSTFDAKGWTRLKPDQQPNAVAVVGID